MLLERTVLAGHDEAGLFRSVTGVAVPEAFSMKAEPLAALVKKKKKMACTK